MKRFWIIWNPNGGNPQVKHPTYESALVEARRLALAHGRDTFYIMKFVEAYQVSAVQQFLPED